MDSSDSEDEIDNLQFLKKDESSDFFQTQNGNCKSDYIYKIIT